MLSRPFASLFAPLLLVACGPKPADDDTPGDIASDTETGDSADSADTADTGDSGATASELCADLGLPVIAFQDATEDDALGALAADFSMETTAGTWNFKTSWSGCESYLFIPDTPDQATGYPDALWDVPKDNRALFEMLPRNTEVFFLSEERDDATRAQVIVDEQDRIANAIEALDSVEDQEWWTARVHFVTEKGTGVDGWLGDTLRSPNWGTAVDRFQRIRYIGSFADPSRYNSSIGWFEPNLSYVANEALYYNFEAEREERLAAQGATTIPIFTGEEVSDPSWAGVWGEAYMELPDADTMATFDSAEFDHSLLCVGDGEYGTCPAWDYLNYLYLCDADDETNCPTEIGRWITTYHREGRWVHDVSGILPLLGEGGRRKVRYYTQQLYNVHLSLRLFNAGKDARPAEYVPLWSGGNFYTENYNARDPMSVAIPADATKVELWTVISGHGGETNEACMEFCNSDHHFYVNGDEYERAFPEAGTSFGCMDVTGTAGAVPNQYGTWWYGRDGWCPGMEVPAVATDITPSVVLGADSILDYEAYKDGGAYTGTGTNMIVASWLVISR